MNVKNELFYQVRCGMNFWTVLERFTLSLMLVWYFYEPYIVYVLFVFFNETLFSKFSFTVM